MKLRIDRAHARILASEFPALAGLEDQLRLGAHAELPMQQLAPNALARLAGLWDEADANAPAGRATLLRSLGEVLHDPQAERLRGGELEQVLPALLRYIGADARRGWLFTAYPDGRALAWCPTRIDYMPANNDEAGKVFLELKANARGGVISQTLRLSAQDIEGHSIAALLLQRGLVRESPALMQAYEHTAERYFD